MYLLFEVVEEKIITGRETPGLAPRHLRECPSRVSHAPRKRSRAYFLTSSLPLEWTRHYRSAQRCVWSPPNRSMWRAQGPAFLRINYGRMKEATLWNSQWEMCSSGMRHFLPFSQILSFVFYWKESSFWTGIMGKLFSFQFIRVCCSLCWAWGGI